MNGRVGYRFHPTDAELVDYFLKHKMNGDDNLVDYDIRLIDLCKYEPWDLPGLAAQGSNDQVWYFFCRRELKYKNASRPKFNRSTSTGHWKLTGRDHPVKAKATNMKIGTKRTFVFYMRGSPKEVRTNWVIHEYEPKTVMPHQKDFVLCKLKEKADDKVDTSASDEGESSHHLVDADTPIQQVLLETFFPGNGINLNPPSSMQPQIHIDDEGISLDDLEFNGVFDNDLGEPTFQFHTNEPQEDPIEMADSFIVVPDEYTGEKYLYALSSDGSNHEETARTHLNHSSSPQSLTGVYLDDLHSDIVYATAQSSIPNFNNGPANSKEYRQTRRVQSITETIPSSTYNQSGKEKNHSHGDEILVMEASCSSADSTIDSYEKINCVGVVGKEFSVHTRSRKHQQQARSGNIKVEKEVTPKTSIVQGKMSGASEYKAREARKNSTRESPKENINVKTEKETSLKLRDNAITGNNKTGSFIRLETSLLSQRSVPVSVYVVNLVIGLFLFITVISEVLILHD